MASFSSTAAGLALLSKPYFDYTLKNVLFFLQDYQRVPGHFGTFCIKGLRILKEQWKYSKVVNKTRLVLFIRYVLLLLKNRRLEKKAFKHILSNLYHLPWGFQRLFEHFAETRSFRVNARNVSIFPKITDEENYTEFFDFAQFTR